MILRILTLFLCAASMALATIAYGADASGELTGSRSELIGQITSDISYSGGPDDAPFLISWTILGSGSSWNYSYTITGPNLSNTGSNGMGVSFWATQIGTTCASDPNCITNSIVDGSPESATAPGPNTSSTGDFNYPGSFTGVRFAGNGVDLPFTVSFESDQAPFYGDFYLRLGQAGVNNHGDSAWNNGSNDPSNSTNLAMDSANYIPVPGDPISSTPEPATHLLLGFGLMMVGLLGRRASRRSGGSGLKAAGRLPRSLAKCWPVR